MRENDTQTKGIGPVPVLFVTVGHRAERTICEFSQVAGALTVPVQGPFGLLSADATGRRLSVAHWTWLSDFDVPVSAQSVDASDDALPTAVASLVRTLQSKEPVADPSRPVRIRMSSYVLVDLSQAGTVDRALHMMRLLRKADPAHDMAVVALTGRTAASGCELDDVWFEAWSALTARLQDDLLAQKIYLLDGRTAGGTWVERPEQMDRFAAQFLLQHGITCRGPLRQNERRRIRPQENVLSVCGSFGMRTIRLDRPEVIARTAQRLVHEDLAALYEETLPEERRRQIDEEAQVLVEQIEGIYEVRSQIPTDRDEEPAAAPYEPAVRNDAVCEAIADAVTRACGRAPLASVCHLLKCLQPKLRRLLTRHKLIERQRVRALAADALQRRDEQTYQPMRVWLENAQAVWADRFTPTVETRPQVAVSRPATKAAWRFGFLFLILGLLFLAAAFFFHERAFALGGALLSLAAAVLTVQPTGWAEHVRTVVPEGREIDKSTPLVHYRRRCPLWVRGVAIALAAIGVGAVTWSLWPDLWTPAGAIQSGFAALLGVIGVTLILTGPVQVRPDQPQHQEAPDHLCPPFWTWRAFGLLCLASAWLILCLRAPSPVQADDSVRWACHIAGLLLIGISAALDLRPRFGRVRLIERIPKVPEPFVGGVAVDAGDSDLVREVTAMIQWIDRLTLDPQQGLLRHGMPDATQGREVLFDFIATDWDRQLARAFRETLRSRMGQSLHDLALEPKAWAQCVVRHLRDPQAQSADLGVLFTLEVVKVWIDSLSVVSLAAVLDADEEKTGHLLGRSASPNWPVTRTEPDVAVCVVAVGSLLWDALAPLSRIDAAPALVRREWDVGTDDILVLQIVQGLTQGWRGYPALPSQVRQWDRSDAQDSDSTPSSQASSHAS